MATATAYGPNPIETRAGGTARIPTNFNSSNNAEYNLDNHRAQRLIAMAGISPSIAAVMAPLVFGGAA